MFTKLAKSNTWRLIGLCLFVALFLTSTVSAAYPNKANNRQDKSLLPPTSYIFESPLLSDVLGMAAKTMQACDCQDQVAYFTYERNKLGWHRLTIYLFGISPDPLTAGIWQEIPFRDASLPTVLWEASKYMQDFGCEAAVQDVRYEREKPSQTDPSDSRPVPAHVVYLVLEWPAPCISSE
ncbi:MAG TPA: hypothetical protein PLD25_20155 [Chloroflexota bacterium]|nr:hypothetical protein [Chloroflexota bacterium]HUM68442.1 hypothetical protein [Chloroflexota bacterium]